MLPDSPVHVGVLTDDLGGRCDRSLLEPIVLGTEAALEAQEVEVVVDGLLMLLDPQAHVDLVHGFLGVFEVVLRQLIEDAVVRIEDLVTVCVHQHLRSHEDALAAERELVRIAVILQVGLGQHVHAVGEEADPHRVAVILVHIVHDVELIKYELRLRGSCLDSLSEALEVRDLIPLFRSQLSAGSGRAEDDAVLDHVLVAQVLTVLSDQGLELVMLELCVLLALVCLLKYEDHLSDPAVLPRDREDVLGHNVVDLHICTNHTTLFIDDHVGEIGNIGHRPAGRFSLLVLVALDDEVRILQHLLHEGVRLRVLDRDLDLLVEEQVADVLADLFGHAEALPVAVFVVTRPVVDPVLVELLHVRAVPAVPHGDLAIEGAVDRVDALLLEIFKYIHVITPSTSSSFSVIGR